MTYETEEGGIHNVDLNKYSYLEMLNNAYKLFNIQADFVELILRDNIKIEKDEDVLFMFEMFRDTPVVLVRVIAVNAAIVAMAPTIDSDVVKIVASNVGGNKVQTWVEGETQVEGETHAEGVTQAEVKVTQVEGVTQVEVT
ncbi:hypothetical protein JCGZ_09503 [Jatropha curcas]|uniref:PB1 domain-containing protein n=1 Tax=Jatropha curcas TaxID=180498 RepID=A0A067KXA0_JATCU|nr:hypothetical protein JCGZ_09503 [Jatropha curcas]